ncbi:MAG: hypothetical protein RIS47_389 [Bacteroidota bacterium]
MPESAEEHGGHEVDVGTKFAVFVAPEGYVEVVFEPSGERNMPAFPEFADVLGFVGRVEIGGQSVAKQEREADGDVGIARKIDIYLERISEYGHDVFEAGIRHGVREYTIDKIDGDVVAYEHFLEQTLQNEHQCLAKFLFVELVFECHLGHKFVGSNYRPGDKLWEKCYVKAEVDEPIEGFYFASINIDGVADCLEGIERYADGQNDFVDGEIAAADVVGQQCEVIDDFELCACEVIDGIDHKIGVFVVEKHAKVQKDAQRNEPFFSVVGLASINGAAYVEIPHGGKKK